MANIVRLETELAKVSRTQTELRDPEANYNKMTLAQFNANYPNVQIEKVMNAMGARSAYIQELVVAQPEFVAGVNNLIATMTADEYRDYMEWIQINKAARYLDDEAEATYFEFFGKVLSGRQEDYPLWQRATLQIEDNMGEALGKLYVERYFPPAAKERMLQLVRNLQTALSERFDAQDWMSSATKAAAKEKLNAFIVKVGYPDKWTDMSALNIDTQKSYYENFLECRRFWNAYTMEQKAGKPVDRSAWQMTPQTVNAYYEPTTNEICFPAGILQYPFFDMEADDAFNYGAIGVVIGHEMTHAFDDEGHMYDKDGNLKNWWTPEDEAKFKEKADMYAAFYDAILVLPDLHANGRMTLGENLADHGGLQVAWTAYKNATAGQTLPTADGLTADQRFFLANASLWAQNITEEEIRRRTITDVHSIGRWRVNGAFPHIDAWYDTYDVKEGDKMFLPKAERLDLW
jgi:putative endopeptidase